jgi:beta-N-acetylhexosaminidase
MRRRAILRVIPPALTVTALAACSAPGGPGGGAGSGSDGGGTASDGGDGSSASDGSGNGSGDGSGSDGGGAEDGETSDGGGDPGQGDQDDADRMAASLSSRQAAGQLVLVGVQAGDVPDRSLITKHHVGGFFLLGTWRSPDAVRQVVDRATETSDDVDRIAPLLCVDQEGGQIRMLRGDAATRTPSAAELGSQGMDAVTEAYSTIGSDLADLGLNAALAPVADVVDPDLGADNAPVGKIGRGFGTEPGTVSRCVDAAVRALGDQGVGATLKHFPGLGRVRGNTDFSSKDITDEVTSAYDPFLEPFRAGIDAGARMVMLSSAVYTKIDPDNPAMFSHAVVTDLLRGKLGFDGLVMTDDVGAAEAVADVPVADRATRLLDAGGNMVITAEPDLAGQLVDAIEQWGEQDEEHRRRLRASVARVLRVKHEVG